MSISMSFFSRKTPQPQPQPVAKPLNSPGSGALFSADPFAPSPNVTTTSSSMSQTRHGKRSGSFRAENTFAPPMNKVVKTPAAQQPPLKATTTPSPPPAPSSSSPPQKRTPPPQQPPLQQQQQQQQMRPQDRPNPTPSPNPTYTNPASKPISLSNSGPDPRDLARPYSTPYPPPGPPGAPLAPPPLPTGPGPAAGPSFPGSAPGLDKTRGVGVDSSSGFQPNEEFIPAAERGIDTKSGGSAGMAGVGRRGFAAAARAAMFVNPNMNHHHPHTPPPPQGLPMPMPHGYPSMGVPVGMGMPMQRPTPPPGGYPAYPYGMNPGQAPGPNQNGMQQQQQNQARRPFVPPHGAPRALDMDSLSRSNNGTPPLSAGSGYSSPSPGLPTVRPSQQQQQQQQAVPFPSSSNSKVSPITSKPLVGINTTPIVPLDSRTSAPASPDSEYGGLAYADSDGDEPPLKGIASRSRSGSTAGSSMKSGSRKDSFSRGVRLSNKEQPIPLPSGSSAMARTISTSSNKSGSSIQFGSVSSRSRSIDRSRRPTGPSSSVTSASSMSQPRGGGGGVAHSRDGSVSSTYSQNSDEGGRAHEGRGGRARANSSAAIAHALGLSQRPPSEYARLGGPGVNSAPGRAGRSASNASSSRVGVGAGGMSGYDKMEGDLHKRDASVTSNVDLDLRRITSTDEADVDRRVRALGVQLKDTYLDANADADARVKEASLPSYLLKAPGHEEGTLGGGGSGGAKAQRSNTVQGIQSPDQKPIKLPTRSMTSPQLDRDKALSAGGGGTGGVGKRTTRRVKTCKQCSKTIEDGRWVSVDGGGVLCERCWKNMYLPKCQRCELPIERAAVSSSDGQLKGKYHKDCFNCSICHKPFPDKSFYVYDGRPLCAYHYHEANDTLCAAAMCGQPIEGPCAISQSGDRYHPEHMTCEHPGYPRCAVRLVEYWEVDGRMLCERHAAWAGRSRGESGSEDEGEDWERRGDLRAMRRVTKFIDLAAGAGLGPLAGVSPGGGGGGDDMDSGLR